MNRFNRSIILMGLALPILTDSVVAETNPPIHAVEISSPRDYGIVMGETFSGEIRVKMAAGYELETATLPRPGSAVSDVLEVRAIQHDRQSLGDEDLHRIILSYQVFKGVREAEILSVPALPLRFAGKGETVETLAPAWSFTLMPIIPSKLPDEAVSLRGDLPMPFASTAGHWRWLAALLAGLGGLGIYATWRLGLPPFRHQASPFLRVARELKRELKKQRRLGSSPANTQLSIKLVHDALNEIAGHTLFAGQLPGFLQTHPEYQSYASELEQFFRVSEQLFFATDRSEANDFPLSRLEKLCWNLALAGRKSA